MVLGRTKIMIYFNSQKSPEEYWARDRVLKHIEKMEAEMKDLKGTLQFSFYHFLQLFKQVEFLFLQMFRASDMIIATSRRHDYSRSVVLFPSLSRNQ